MQIIAVRSAFFFFHYRRLRAKIWSRQAFPEILRRIGVVGMNIVIFALLMVCRGAPLDADSVAQIAPSALSSSASTLGTTPVPRVRIYFQGEEFGDDAEKIVRRLNANGFNASAEDNGMHQLPQWVNSVRYFHHEDAPVAQWVRDLIHAFYGERWNLTPLDLTDAFKGIKIRPRSIEVWVCDSDKNDELPQDSHEPRFAKWTPLPWPTAPFYDEEDDVTVTPDPDDEMYCMGWRPADRSNSLDGQDPEIYQNDSSTLTADGQVGETYLHDQYSPGFEDSDIKDSDWEIGKDGAVSQDRLEFEFFESPADHGHGAPNGMCGTRMLICMKDPSGKLIPTGFWEDLDQGFFECFWPGNRHCLFVTAGGSGSGNPSLPFTYFVVDEMGHVLDTGPGDSFLDEVSAIWVPWKSGEALWEMDSKGITLKTPSGKEIWANHDRELEFPIHFFSTDRLYAFRELGQVPYAEIYSVDGKQRWKFPLPFSNKVGQKGFLGLNRMGELVLRVDRNIYRVDHNGKPFLEATLPVYKGRHRSLEEERPGVHFDVEWDFAPNHQYGFETLVPEDSDHPRPLVRFNINTFNAEESLNEGKNWHALNIKAGGPAS